MKDLKTVIIQANLAWENPKQNRAYFSEKIDAIFESVDLIILPEMFSTGFTMNPNAVAESMDGETILWMKNFANQKDCAITGSLIIKENEHFYNRLVFVYPSGEIKTYDKRHSFTLAGEHKIYTSGTEKLILHYKGWNICPLICYDLRFPVWARNVDDYDLLLYVANWPKPRIAAWDALLKARAIENVTYCIGVNRVGFDINKHEYIGHSAAYNSLGEKVSNIPISSEMTEIVTLSAKHLEKTREKLQFLNDMDSFHINIK